MARNLTGSSTNIGFRLISMEILRYSSIKYQLNKKYILLNIYMYMYMYMWAGRRVGSLQDFQEKNGNGAEKLSRTNMLEY